MTAAGADSDTPLSCPYCTDTVPFLKPLEAGLKLRLQEQAKLNPVPNAVCAGCFEMMEKLVTKGAALQAEQKSKQQNRLVLWKSRVGLVRQGKKHMETKSFSDAAVSYEKYIRVLEICYDKKSGELSPDLFRSDKRAQEVTVIASVYWDLMRVYDSNARYSDRQIKTAEKLAEFVRFSPVFPHIVRKAESQVRTAKNPEAFRKFLKLSDQGRPRCFIATSAFNYQPNETVTALCLFRDHFLQSSQLGRGFIRIYYRISPPLARLLDLNPWLKPLVQQVLRRLTKSKFLRNRLNP